MYVTEQVTTARREIAHNAKQKGVLPLIKFGGMQSSVCLRGRTPFRFPPLKHPTFTRTFSKQAVDDNSFVSYSQLVPWGDLRPLRGL